MLTKNSAIYLGAQNSRIFAQLFSADLGYSGSVLKHKTLAKFSLPILGDSGLVFDEIPQSESVLIPNRHVLFPKHKTLAKFFTAVFGTQAYHVRLRFLPEGWFPIVSEIQKVTV